MRHRIPLMAFSMLIVTALGRPPGNMAFSAAGPIFISLHPAGHPETKVAEIKSGRRQPYPDVASRRERFATPLARRIDRQQHLWLLDYARHGIGDVKLVAIDLKHDQVETNGKLQTRLKNPERLRWPDGFSSGPDGWLYVSDSALQHVMLNVAPGGAGDPSPDATRFTKPPSGTNRVKNPYWPARRIPWVACRTDIWAAARCPRRHNRRCCTSI